jgi:hypothetical protein
VRVRAAQQQSVGLQRSSGAEWEALKGVKVVSAADGFEVELLSLWQVGKHEGFPCNPGVVDNSNLQTQAQAHSRRQPVTGWS